MSTARLGRDREHKVTVLPESERFWRRVRVGAPDQCWPWVGYVHANGYAAFVRTGGDERKEMAHRVAYELTVGSPVPRGETIDHLCRNRRCMNPAHMEVVSRGENARRGQGWINSAAVRSARAEIACIHGHPREQFGRREPSTGAWRCRECRRLSARRRRAEGKVA